VASTMYFMKISTLFEWVPSSFANNLIWATIMSMGVQPSWVWGCSSPLIYWLVSENKQCMYHQYRDKINLEIHYFERVWRMWIHFLQFSLLFSFLIFSSSSISKRSIPSLGIIIILKISGFRSAIEVLSVF